MKSKKIGIIIGLIVISTFVLALIIYFYINSNKQEKNGGTNQKENIIKPYVEENNIEIASSTDEFKIPIKPYARNKEDKTPIEVDGVAFEDTIGTYKFYDYSISDVDENNYVTYSFKYDVVVPISYTVNTSKLNNTNWSRSYAFLQANVFDYYTGELYHEKNFSVTGNVYYHDINNENDDMAYTNITWNGNEYKIGVRMESSSKWDGITKVNSSEGTDTYNDTNRTTINAYIYAPKDYDGLMIALNKNGTSKDIVLKQIEFNNKYNELLKDEQNSGEKSNELVEIEKKLNKIYKLLDEQHMDIKERNKNDFYVIRVNEINN